MGWLRIKNQQGQAKGDEGNGSEEHPGSDGDSELRTPLLKSLLIKTNNSRS